MPSINIHSVIQDIVSTQVQNALKPYMEVLQRVSTAFDSIPASKPIKPLPLPSTVPPRRRTQPVLEMHHAKYIRQAKLARMSTTNSIAQAGKFKLGDMVEYQQGRGRIRAKVIAVQYATGLLTLEKVEDARQIIRPASKVIPPANSLQSKSSPTPLTPLTPVAAVKPIVRKRLDAENSDTQVSEQELQASDANQPKDPFWEMVSKKMQEQQPREKNPIEIIVYKKDECQ